MYIHSYSKFSSTNTLMTLFLTLGINGTTRPQASNGIQAALLQQPQKQPQLASFKQQNRRNASGNRLLEAAAVTARHPRIVEV